MAQGTKAVTLPVAERLRIWIAKYNIVFEGPVPSQEWPSQYESVFRSVREIDQIRYDEYGPEDNRGLLTVSEMKARVANIRKVAYTCLRSRANEQTWRLKIEHWILWRFDAEVACHKCRKRLWISEIQPLPHDEDRAEELRIRRAQRVLCTCSQSERAMVDRWEGGQTRVFADRAEDIVLHQDSMELLGCGVKERKPDRIFGLEKTTMFDKYVSAEGNENLRHSPFADGRILYPFLIIEAKSEKGSPGFDSIESQTAFPIRTLLQLQDKLALHTGIKINPLLWFLANQGEEWRVYAAVVDNSHFRVFDLWHGTILSQDCALQLLLIIDCICDWARDIYRLDILRCLSRGQIDLRAITPAESLSQSNNGLVDVADESASSSTGTVTPQVQTPPQHSVLDDPALDELIPDLDIAMTDVDGLEEDTLQRLRKNVNNDHRLLRYDKSHSNSPIWTKTATIQHSNFVNFRFRYSTIPESLGQLRKLLSAADESVSLAVAARKTLSLFECHAAVQTDMAGIGRIANLWVGAIDLATTGIDICSEGSVQVRFGFHTFFDIESWQTIRVLDCLVCSQKAWNLLLQVSTYENAPAEDPWMKDQRADLCAYVTPLRYFHGEESITAALMKLELQLCRSNLNTSDLKWEESTRFPVEDLFYQRDNWEHLHMRQKYVHVTTQHRELAPNDLIAAWLKSMLQTQGTIGKNGAVLLRKPSSWPESCPFFSLAVFDPQVDFENEQNLGCILDKVVDDKDIYVVTDGERKSRPFAEADRRAVELWSSILKGDVPPSTQWPGLPELRLLPVGVGLRFC